MDLARTEAQPNLPGRILITRAGAPACSSFGPVTKIPDTFLETNSSKIPESEPQPTILSTREDLVYPDRRCSALGDRKVFELRSALTPDSVSAAPPHVTVGVSKNAGCLLTHLFKKNAFTANVQQRFALNGPD